MTELRTLGPDDWRLWRELRLLALAEAPYAYGSTLAEWQGDGDREQRWRDRLAVPGSVNLVALVDSRPVGMVSGVPGEEAGSAELISMYVAPGTRGAGVSDVLVEAVVRWAEQTGARVVKLSVRPDNHRAAALYRRHGFADSDEPGELLSDGVRREQVMVRTAAR